MVGACCSLLVSPMIQPDEKPAGLLQSSPDTGKRFTGHLSGFAMLPAVLQPLSMGAQRQGDRRSAAAWIPTQWKRYICCPLMKGHEKEAIYWSRMLSSAIIIIVASSKSGYVGTR